jgi:hypothetical protein
MAQSGQRKMADPGEVQTATCGDSPEDARTRSPQSQARESRHCPPARQRRHQRRRGALRAARY